MRISAQFQGSTICQTVSNGKKEIVGNNLQLKTENIWKILIEKWSCRNKNKMSKRGGNS